HVIAETAAQLVVAGIAIDRVVFARRDADDRSVANERAPDAGSAGIAVKRIDLGKRAVSDR
ncbi:hypothetical protein LTR94_036098, partial [Friedmanniomyces endolithicus]